MLLKNINPISAGEKDCREFFVKNKIISNPQNDLLNRHVINQIRFVRKKKPATIKFKIIALVIFLAVWVACLAYLPYFRVNKVKYTGLHNNTGQELDELIYGNYLNKKSRLPFNNYFLIRPNRISEDLNKAFSFEQVEVKKVFPDTLEINVREKISSIIYDNGQKYFLLDSGGAVIKYLADVEPDEIVTNSFTTTTDLFSLTSSTTSTPIIVASTYEHTPNTEKINKLFGDYPIIYDKRNLEIDLKQTGVLPAEYIAAIILWQTDLKQQGKAIPKLFVMNNLNSGIIIDTAQSWDILFQPKNDATAQINTFKAILPSIKPKQYVDLRFGEKVYWK